LIIIVFIFYIWRHVIQSGTFKVKLIIKVFKVLDQVIDVDSPTLFTKEISIIAIQNNRFFLSEALGKASGINVDQLASKNDYQITLVNIVQDPLIAIIWIVCSNKVWIFFIN